MVFFWGGGGKKRKGKRGGGFEAEGPKKKCILTMYPDYISVSSYIPQKMQTNYSEGYSAVDDSPELLPKYSVLEKIDLTVEFIKLKKITFFPIDKIEWISGMSLFSDIL